MTSTELLNKFIVWSSGARVLLAEAALDGNVRAEARITELNALYDEVDALRAPLQDELDELASLSLTKQLEEAPPPKEDRLAESEDVPS
jgi:hypothetical protein